MCDGDVVNGHEFLRKLKRLAKDATFRSNTRGLTAKAVTG
jgi:hypothetical protein